MNRRSLKLVLTLSCGLWAVAANAAPGAPAAKGPAANVDHAVFLPTRDAIVPKATSNLTDHGGGVIISAKVVFIFWGPSFANAASPDFVYAQTLQAFRNQFGTTPEYNVITQYSGIHLTNLAAGTPDWFDTSVPPINVTDDVVHTEVILYLASHAFDASTIYEVILPRSSYSSKGTRTSCGGPSVSYCAYHNAFTGTSGTVIYSVQPYPSCSACSKVAGWSDVQNQERFVCHETREAVTDPVNGWWDDKTGQEADDKCAASPTPFIGTNGFAYQYEWSNASRSCVRTR